MTIKGIPEIRVYRLWLDDNEPITLWVPIERAQRAEKLAKARGLTAEQLIIEAIVEYICGDRRKST
jgi:hypothetical protein